MIFSLTAYDTDGNNHDINDINGSGFLRWLFQLINSLEHSLTVPVLTFSGKEHSRSSLDLVFCTNDNIELKSFTDVAID